MQYLLWTLRDCFAWVLALLLYAVKAVVLIPALIDRAADRILMKLR